MNKEKMKADLEALEKREFYLSMKDRWDDEDYRIHRDLVERISLLKKLIQEAE